MTYIKEPTDKELYFLDSTGYLVLESAIPKNQVDAATHRVNRRLEKSQPRKFTFFDMGEVFWDIMTNPRILGIVNAVCGEWFRLDHAFGICQLYQETAVFPHGGTGSGLGGHHWGGIGGKPVCHGQLSVSIALTRSGGDSGGLAMLPGSHKSCVPIEGAQLVDDDAMLRLPYVSPELSPGDVLIMPENLVHGNVVWQHETPRLALYYMYYPTYAGYRVWDERQQEHAKLARNELERRIFRPQGVATIDDKHTMLGPNVKPPKTIPVCNSGDPRQRADSERQDRRTTQKS